MVKQSDDFFDIDFPDEWSEISSFPQVEKVVDPFVFYNSVTFTQEELKKIPVAQGACFVLDEDF